MGCICKFVICKIQINEVALEETEKNQTKMKEIKVKKKKKITSLSVQGINNMPHYVTITSQNMFCCGAHRVEVFPGPLGAVDLVLQLLGHDALRVCVVEMGEVHERLAHVLVQVDGVRVLHELTHHLPVLVLHHQHLLWLGHAADHDVAYLTNNNTSSAYNDDCRIMTVSQRVYSIYFIS